MWFSEVRVMVPAQFHCVILLEVFQLWCLRIVLPTRSVLQCFRNLKERDKDLIKMLRNLKVFLLPKKKYKDRSTPKQKSNQIKTKISRARFWSPDLWVMGPARFHCATLLHSVRNTRFDLLSWVYFYLWFSAPLKGSKNVSREDFLAQRNTLQICHYAKPCHIIKQP